MTDSLAVEELHLKFGEEDEDEQDPFEVNPKEVIGEIVISGESPDLDNGKGKEGL